MSTPADLETGAPRSEPSPPVRSNTVNTTSGSAWTNPIFRRKTRDSTFAGLSSEEATKKHEKKLAQGVPPKHHRFNPFKASRIVLKSTSKISAWSNILFPTIPAGIALWYTQRDKHPLAVFILNFLAMVPAGNLLSFASGELQAKLPKTLGASLEIFTGAVVELIVCIILLFQKQYDVVRAALLGSMLANLLLVTGACFFAGGIAYREQDIADFLFFQLKTHNTAFHHVLETAEENDADAHKEQYRRKLSLLEALFLTLVGLTFVSFAAYFMVQQIPYIVENRGISDPFMGLILVPLVEKAAEHLSALDEAWDNQLDLALSHCLGATIQTALLVAPIVVIVGWIAGLNMDLNFEYFMAFSLLLSVLVVGNFVRDRKTNWLEGSFLLMVYFVVAVAAFYYPNPPEYERKVDSTGGEGEGATETISTLAEAATSAAAERIKRMVAG
ncbi:hypothetical protein AA313_de0209718 [Arthrobotrys entomopaga]|nr:hypothetical protein AA313_de0209718 [Arthrobotrys entomopaga]